jgi:hypothetical protein
VAADDDGADVSAQRRTRLAATGVLAYLYVPVVGTLVLAGWKLGWQTPVALIAATVCVMAKLKLDVRRRKSGAKPFPWQLQLPVLVALGTTVGGLLVGAPGFFAGLLLGVALGLPPVSVRNKDGVVAPLDPTDEVQRTEVVKTFGLAMAAIPVAFVVLFLGGLLVERLA